MFNKKLPYEKPTAVAIDFESDRVRILEEDHAKDDDDDDTDAKSG